MSRYVRTFALALCVVLPAAALAAPPRQHIEETLAKFRAAFNAKDAATVAGLYTEDAALLPPDAAPVDGRAAIQAFWQGAIEAGITIDVLRALEVVARGDTAYEVGELRISVPGDQGVTKLDGKYIVVWKRSGHTWRLHRDIWNMTPAAE